MKKKLMWEPSQFLNLKFLRTEFFHNFSNLFFIIFCSYEKKGDNRPTPNTGIYLPLTSKRSALHPKPGPGWYDFIFGKIWYQYQLICSKVISAQQCYIQP